MKNEKKEIQTKTFFPYSLKILHVKINTETLNKFVPTIVLYKRASKIHQPGEKLILIITTPKAHTLYICRSQLGFAYQPKLIRFY